MAGRCASTRRRSARNAPVRVAVRSAADGALAGGVKNPAARGVFLCSTSGNDGAPGAAEHDAMLSKLRLIALATAGALLAAACAGASWSSRQTTAQALTAVLAGDQRTAEERARDVYRHPKETLLFFGLRPEMSVLEVWPEPGYYSAIIAPLVRAQGKYYAGVIAVDPASRHSVQRSDDYRQRLAARPDLYDRVSVVTFPAARGGPVSPGRPAK